MNIQAIAHKWAAIKPAMIATQASPKHIQSVLEDMQRQIAFLCAALQAEPLDKPAPTPAIAKLVRLPYANEFYICTCGAGQKDECTCSQETVVSTRPNKHLRDPGLVEWLGQQTGQFTATDVARHMGITEADREIHPELVVPLIIELNHYGCTYQKPYFTAPSAETLSGLHLRRPAGNQLQPEARARSLNQRGPHPELSPVPHATHRAGSADQVAQQSPQ